MKTWKLDRRVGESASRKDGASIAPLPRLADSPTRRSFPLAAILVGLSAFAVAGCADDTPPPPRAAVPPVGTYTVSTEPPPKPLPMPEPGLVNRPAFNDEPLVNQPPPEQTAFVMTYEQVGRPRITLFVNRSLGGQIVPTTDNRPATSVQRTREATGAVKAEASGAVVDSYGRTVATPTDRFESTGPAQLRDRTDTYLSPGEYDEVSAKRIDYDAIESVMSDWMAANGRIALVSPNLNAGQIDQLQRGQTQPLGDLSKNGVDVLVQVQARATKQTPQGLEVRLIAEAMNTKGGESLGRAFVDVPPPLEKQTINEYTRYLARKLMSDMTATWSAPRGGPPPQGDAPTHGQAVPSNQPPAAPMPQSPPQSSTPVPPMAPTQPEPSALSPVPTTTPLPPIQSLPTTQP